MPFFSRLWLAIVCFFKIVFDGAFASRVLPLREAPAALPAPGVKPPVPERRADQALQLLGMLQREGRLVDFLQEEIGAYADAQIGAAARAVHAGCRKALTQVLTLVPIRDEAEGAEVTVPAGFDPAQIRLTGNVVGQPPFKGVLRHHGWKVTDARLPAATSDGRVLAPAEVEL
jgi:hypothetical protein